MSLTLWWRWSNYVKRRHPGQPGDAEPGGGARILHARRRQLSQPGRPVRDGQGVPARRGRRQGERAPGWPLAPARPPRKAMPARRRRSAICCSGAARIVRGAGDDDVRRSSGRDPIDRGMDPHRCKRKASRWPAESERRTAMGWPRTSSRRAVETRRAAAPTGAARPDGARRDARGAARLRRAPGVGSGAPEIAAWPVVQRLASIRRRHVVRRLFPGADMLLDRRRRSRSAASGDSSRWSMRMPLFFCQAPAW